MNLNDYLRTLRRGWLMILVLAVLGAGAGVLLTALSSKVYRSSVQIFVATSNPSTATDLSQGNSFVQDRVQSYVSVASSPRVTDPVASELDLGLTSSQLSSAITADAPQGKVLIDLFVTNGNPQRAATIADAVAKQFISVVEALEQTDSSGKSLVKLNIIQPAEVSSAPISPDGPLNVGLGFAVGLIIGLGVVLVREALDNTVKTSDDLDAMGVPVLGWIPMDKRTARSPVAFLSDPHSGRSEAYRQVRTNMQFVDVDNPPRVISFTSAKPGEGKTTTAINFAAALAEAGHRTCLVECDLRRPTIARVLGLVGEVGLTNVLIGEAPIESVLQNAGENLAVLTSGPTPPNPTELVMSDHARSLIREIAESVDYVIIDSPPLLPVTDGAELATIADATVMVVAAGSTTKEQAQRALDSLERVGERAIGAVLNMQKRGPNSGSYYYNYQGYRADKPPVRPAGTRAVEADDSDRALGVGTQ